MQTLYTFFDIIEAHYAKKLPYVVYSKPNSSYIKCWLQQDNKLYKTQTFSESGFVFAPFNNKSSAIIFPKIASNFYSVTVEETPSKDLHIPKTTIHNFKENTSKKNYIELVSKVIENLNKNHFQKVVLSRKEIHTTSTTNPIELFKKLLNAHKNEMVYCWYHPKIGLWLAATPELLFNIEDKELTTISLAGTKKQNSKGLPIWTKKELDEQQIVTDYIKKQIHPHVINTKISTVKSVKAGHLWHLKTRLTSILNPNTKILSIINALHPTPAVCGFPKHEAKMFILKYEGYDRSFYTGYLGELNLKCKRNTNRNNVENKTFKTTTIKSNFYVNLRCMQIQEKKAIIYIGGGITKNSVPELEWEETCDKAHVMAKILE